MALRRTSLLIGGLVLLHVLPLAVNPRVHLRADAMNHTAIAFAVLRHGVPPGDPYIAGQPLHYYWAYNALAAWASRLLGCHPLPVMVWLGPAGLLVMLVGVARLVRTLGGSEGGAALAVVLACVGLSGWGWIVLAARWLGGEVGVAESLSLGVSEFLHKVVIGYDMRLGMLTSLALLATAFLWTLAFCPLVLDSLLRFLAGRGGRPAVAFVVAAAAASYANPLGGAALLAVVICGLLVVILTHPGRAGGALPIARRRALVSLGLVALVVALLAPYLVATLGKSAGRDRMVWPAWPDGFHVWGLLLGLLPLWVCVAVTGRPRQWGRGLLWVAFSALAFAAAFVLLRVVDGNEIKFLFTASLLLAIYVGAGAGGLPRWRRRLLWLVAASAVPTTALGLAAHALDPGLVTSQAERDTFVWVAEHTPPDTVVVSRWRATLVPIFADRDLYLPDIVGFHRGARYDRAEWARREALMQRLDRGEVAPVLEQIARELGRPVVLIAQTQLLRPAAPRLRILFAAGDLQVWALAEDQTISMASP